MHQASHWKCQCRILTARTFGHGKKMCRPWSQLAGNMTCHLALIRGNENRIGGYNLIFVLFFSGMKCEWSLLVSRGKSRWVYRIHLDGIYHLMVNDEWTVFHRRSSRPRLPANSAKQRHAQVKTQGRAMVFTLNKLEKHGWCNFHYNKGTINYIIYTYLHVKS